MKLLKLLPALGLVLLACGEGTLDTQVSQLLDESDRIVPKSFQAPNIAFGDDVFTTGNGAAELFAPAILGRSVDGLVSGFAVHRLELEEGNTVRLNGWSSHWAAYYVFGPARLNGQRPLVASRQMSNPLKIGLETRYFDFQASLSGDYLLVVGGVEGDEIDYVMLPQCVAGSCTVSQR